MAPETTEKRYSDQVSKTVLLLGIPLPSVREERLDFPRDFAEVSDDEVPHHLAYWGAMAGYVGFKVSILVGASALAEMAYEQEYDLKFMSSAQKFPTVTERRHWTGTLLHIRDLKLDAVRLSADLAVLRAVHDAYTLKYNAWSRELTRRIREKELEQR